MHNNDEFAPGEEKAPVNAPDWARTGYKGSLKSSVEKYIGRSCSPLSKEGNNTGEEVEGRGRSNSVVIDDYNNDNEGKGGNMSEEERVSLVSEEYDSEKE